MNERLIAFLQAEELTSARFAEIMSIQRSGVSHLLSGRNNPGYEFFEKFLQKFPAINIEWLISGRGKMYKEQIKPVIASQPVVKQPLIAEEPNLFSRRAEEPVQVPSSSPAPQIAPSLLSSPPSPSPASSYPLPSAPSPVKHERNITKVIILYSDGTFDERG